MKSTLLLALVAAISLSACGGGAGVEDDVRRLGRALDDRVHSAGSRIEDGVRSFGRDLEDFVKSENDGPASVDGLDDETESGATYVAGQKVLVPCPICPLP